MFGMFRKVCRRPHKEQPLDELGRQRLRDLGIEPESLERSRRYHPLLFYPVWPSKDD